MSEGPFKKEFYKEVGLIKLWMESEGYEDSGVPQRIAAISNLHPFVREAREKMEYILESDDSTMESRHVAKTFLSKYFPEKESGG